MSHDDLVAEFQSITGENLSRATEFLTKTSWHLSHAITDYYDSNLQPEEIHPLALPSLLLPLQVNKQVTEDFILLDEFYTLYRNRQPSKIIPLKGVKIHVQIIDFIAKINASQLFYNDENSPIEATFKFDQPWSTLCGFSIEKDGKLIKGVCKEKNQAMEDYDDTIASGHGAYLVKPEIDGSFSVDIGNLPPQQESILHFSYFSELKTTDDDATVLELPMLRLALDTKLSQKSRESSISNGYTVDIDIEFFNSISSILPLNYVPQISIQGNQASIKLADSKGGLPFSLFIYSPRTNVPRCFMGILGKSEKEIYHKPKLSRALMVSLYPQIPKESDSPVEMIFIVDRSGSMSGSRIAQVKNALQLFLRSLPIGTLFNVIGFGTKFETLFPKSIPFDEDTLQVASLHAASLSANLGGTDILSPLKHVLNNPVNPSYPRQIFCLTDGDVPNTIEVLKLVKNRIGNSRIFVFGIGSDVGKKLVIGLAKFGNGVHEFIESGSRIETQVLKQLQRALQPVLTNINIEWNKTPVVQRTTPYGFPPIFSGQRLVVYSYLRDEELPKTSIEIEATVGDKKYSFSTSIDLSSIHCVEGDVIHLGTACNLIQSLINNDSKRHRDEIVSLSCQWGISNRFTLYIAKEFRQIAVQDPIKKLDINQNNLNENVCLDSYIGSSMNLSRITDESEDSSGEDSSGEDSSSGDSNRSGDDGDDEAVNEDYLFLDKVNFDQKSLHDDKLYEVLGLLSEKPVTINQSLELETRKKPVFTSKDRYKHTKKSTSQETEEKPKGKLKSRSPVTSPSSMEFHASIPNRIDPHVRKVDQFILLQRADGSFDSSKIESFVNKNQEQIERSMPDVIRNDVRYDKQKKLLIWSTALAIKLLERDFYEFRDEWILLVEKSKKFLEKHLEKSVLEVLGLALKFLS